MKERLEYDEKSPNHASFLDLQYKVIKEGPFYSDIIPGSHSALVTFKSISTNEKGITGNSTGCLMTWNITFSTKKWSSFYKVMTQWAVGIVASTIEESLALPRLLSMTSTIDGIDSNIHPQFARKECLEFFWAQGGGLPLIPPIPYGKVLNEGGGTARQSLLRIPPLLTESIISISNSEEVAEFWYRLNDPGWLTFPFLIHTHVGRVRFISVDSSKKEGDAIFLKIEWDVEIRTYKFAAPMVEKLVEMTVSTILRNLRIRLMQPGALVVVKPPRGNINLLMGRESLGTVAKETWLGGVLDAHLSDKRSTIKQTSSLLQPWSWGRSGRGDDNDCVRFKWSDGYCF